MEHAQTCPTPDVVTVMTQQPASPPDVSIAGMTKSSSKVLGRFPTIKSITGRWCYRKANIKRVQLYARPKSPGFERGSGCSFFNKNSTELGQSRLHDATIYTDRYKGTTADERLLISSHLGQDADTRDL
jgi:hypothetical protein